MSRVSPRKVVDSDNSRPAPCQVTFAAGGQAFKGTATHFDETGMLIFCTTPLPVNVRLEISLKFPELKHAVEVRGEVVWSNVFGPDDPITPRAMGVKFMTMESTTTRLLVDLSQKYQIYGDQYRCYFR